jgi:putative oxidoreductase
MRALKATRTVILWVLQLFACLGFVVIGIAKFRAPFWIHGFARWGYPDWFRLQIGVLEVASGVLLAFPRTASYAAALLVCIMAGAAGTLAVHGERMSAPIVWVVLLAIVGIARFRRAWRPAATRAALASGPV